MENLDNYIEGDNNPNNPANQKETPCPYSDNTLEMFLDYEENPTHKKLIDLKEAIEADQHDAEILCNAKKIHERLVFWKSKENMFYAQTLYYASKENTAAYENCKKQIAELENKLNLILS